MIVIHPWIHEFHIEADMGNMDVSLFEEQNSLVKWALETRHALELCITGSQF